MQFGKNYVEPPVKTFSKEAAEVLFSKEKVCSFFGNSAAELGIRDDFVALGEEIRTKLRREITKACKDGYRVFVSGFEEGPEIWAAETVLRFKKIYETYGETVRLFAVLPYRGTELYRSMEEQIRFQRLLSYCDGVIFTNYEADGNAVRERTLYTVNRSKKLIAVSNAEKGNILFAVNTALQKKLEISLIECNKRTITASRTLKAR